MFGLYQTSFIDFYGGWSLQDSSYLGMTLKNGIHQTSFIDFYGGWSLQDSSFLGMTLKNGIQFSTICFKKTMTQTVQSSRGTRDLVWASSNFIHRFLWRVEFARFLIPRNDIKE